jgi:hypothetical protein
MLHTDSRRHAVRSKRMKNPEVALPRLSRTKARLLCQSRHTTLRLATASLPNDPLDPFHHLSYLPLQDPSRIPLVPMIGAVTVARQSMAT